MAEERVLHEDFRRIKPALEGELVRLRALEREDLDRISEMFNEPDVLAGLRRAIPESSAEAHAWLASVRKDPEQAIFLVETSAGEAVGTCGLHEIDSRNRSARLGIWIGKAFWGHGYGTDAMRVLCRFGFRHMNLQRIELEVYETNPSAKHVYEKIGFRVEGTRRRAQFLGGRYVDAYVMGLLAEELRDASEAND